VLTPGHSPGHLAFFRQRDRVLITGDAILTVDLNSIPGLLASVSRGSQPRLAGPPWYTNWNRQAMETSIAALAKLEPQVVAAGHGVPMTGAATSRELQAFGERYSRTDRRT
jgi:glyoxylase-like metal-dependent hydrolase (beta-lactamase superfamily II)